jgi:hypothetical protein
MLDKPGYRMPRRGALDRHPPRLAGLKANRRKDIPEIVREPGQPDSLALSFDRAAAIIRERPGDRKVVPSRR